MEMSTPTEVTQRDWRRQGRGDRQRASWEAQRRVRRGSLTDGRAWWEELKVLLTRPYSFELVWMMRGGQKRDLGFFV